MPAKDTSVIRVAYGFITGLLLGVCTDQDGPGRPAVAAWRGESVRTPPD